LFLLPEQLLATARKLKNQRKGYRPDSDRGSLRSSSSRPIRLRDLRRLELDFHLLFSRRQGEA
jgi:hypothetical protein